MMPWSVIFKFSSCVACTCPGPFFWGEPASWRWVHRLTGGLLLVTLHPCAGSCLFWFVQLFLSHFCCFVELSFSSVSQARHLLGAILRCLFVFCYLLVGAGFDSPAKLACWCTPV